MPCGDHAAVDTTLAYSDIQRPTKTWCLPLHTLADPDCVKTIRIATAASLTRNAAAAPTTRFRAWLADIRGMLVEKHKAEGRAHRLRKADHYRRLALVENALGEGLGPECHIMEIADPTRRESRYAELTNERAWLERQIDETRRVEDERWLIDRCYQLDITDETCSRAFFEKKRAAERVDSHISAIRTEHSSKIPGHPSTNTYRKQADMNTAADRFYGSTPGGLFNLPHADDPEAEAAMHAALRRDGKVLPPERATRLSTLESIISTATVKAAITGMARGAVPGIDGFPTEFYALFVLKPRPPGTEGEDEEQSMEQAEADRVIALLVEVFTECAANRCLPSDWNTSVTTLLHKKGPLDLLANYRPISVCSVIYKILSRCLADALQTALPWLLDPAQVACQEGKSCYANTRYIQDLIHHCDTTSTPGLLLFCDATKAFDRVQHGYLLRTMRAMHIPDAFISLYSVLLTDATTRIKVNGHLGDPIALRNGVRQGDPVAPLTFLLSLQPLLSMVRLSQIEGIRVPTGLGTWRRCKIQGIPIPTLDGRALTCKPIAAMADDIGICLSDALQLPDTKCMMQAHERASGALNNWGKTYGLPVGPLAGTALTMPPGWDPRHVDLSADPVRYLGIFLGTPEKVALKLVGAMNQAARDAAGPQPDSLTHRMTHRIEGWATLGVASTYAGRNLVI